MNDADQKNDADLDADLGRIIPLRVPAVRSQVLSEASQNSEDFMSRMNVLRRSDDSTSSVSSIQSHVPLVGGLSHLENSLSSSPPLGTSLASESSAFRRPAKTMTGGISNQSLNVSVGSFTPIHSPSSSSNSRQSSSYSSATNSYPPLDIDVDVAGSANERRNQAFTPGIAISPSEMTNMHRSTVRKEWGDRGGGNKTSTIIGKADGHHHNHHQEDNEAKRGSRGYDDRHVAGNATPPMGAGAFEHGVPFPTPLLSYDGSSRNRFFQSSGNSPNNGMDSPYNYEGAGNMSSNSPDIIKIVRQLVTNPHEDESQWSSNSSFPRHPWPLASSLDTSNHSVESVGSGASRISGGGRSRYSNNSDDDDDLIPVYRGRYNGGGGGAIPNGSRPLRLSQSSVSSSHSLGSDHDYRADDFDPAYSSIVGPPFDYQALSMSGGGDFITTGHYLHQQVEYTFLLHRQGFAQVWIFIIKV